VAFFNRFINTNHFGIDGYSYAYAMAFNWKIPMEAKGISITI